MVFDISNKESETTGKIELEPSTPPDPKHDQFQMMFKAFHAMSLSPQGSTAEELDKWITNYSIKKEQKPTVGHSLTLLTTTDDAAVRPKIKHQQATAISSYPPKVRVSPVGTTRLRHIRHLAL